MLPINHNDDCALIPRRYLDETQHIKPTGAELEPVNWHRILLQISH
jgi:hypothetical protein